MLGFRAFHTADATLAGIEAANMIRKGQFDANGLTTFQQFAKLAAQLPPSSVKKIYERPPDRVDYAFRFCAAMAIC